MARIRTIKPEFPQYQYLAECTRDARLLYLLLKTPSDDFGRLRADSRMLARTLFPYDEGLNDARPLMDAWLADLVEHNCVVVYDVAGQRYLQITHWADEERVDKPTPSKLPAPGDELVTASELRRASGLHNPMFHPPSPARIREDSRGFASPREDSPSSLGRDKTLGRDSRKGGDVGEGNLNGHLELTPKDAPTTRAGRALTKLPNPYPYSPQHERIALEILPADADGRAEFDNAFCAYWHSNGKLKADWIACWRVWCSNAATRGQYARKKPDPNEPAPQRASPHHITDWVKPPGGPSGKGDA